MADFRCGDCGRPMVSQRVHREDPAGWRARGYVRHNAGDLCIGCYARCRRGGNRPHRAPRRPKVTIQATYSLHCERCGPVDLDGVSTRAEVEIIRDRHAAAHMAADSKRTQPPVGVLSDAEVARLRAAVGYRGAA